MLKRLSSLLIIVGLMIPAPTVAEVACETAYRLVSVAEEGGLCLMQMQVTHEHGCSDNPCWYDDGAAEWESCRGDSAWAIDHDDFSQGAWMELPHPAWASDFMTGYGQ